MAENQVKVTSTDTVPNYLYPKIQAGNGIAIRNNGSSIRIDAIDTNVVGTIQNVIQAGDRVTVTNTSNYVVVSADVQTGDHKVMASSADTSPNYLDSKILQGSGITLNTESNYIMISADTQTGDHKVIVDSNDTNPQYLGLKLKSGAGVNISYYNHDKMEIAALGQVKVNLLGTMDYLENKLIQGSGITLTKTNNDITIAADAQAGDHKILVDSSDTTPGYLSSKLTAGSNITITNNGTDLEISATGGGGGMTNPMTTAGDLIIGGASGTPDRLGIGADDQIFTVYSGAPKWRHLVNGSGITLETTSNYIKITADSQAGDHKVVVDGNDTTPDYLSSKLTAGSNITITNNGTDLEISATDTGFANPMTAAGDLIVGGTAGAPGALAVGTENQIITVSSGTPTWTDRPLVTDWSCPPIFMIHTWTRKADRTYYLRLYPSTSFSEITALTTLVKNPNSGDEVRGAIYNWQRQMMYYGTLSGNTTTVKEIPMTKLTGVTDDFNGQQVHYLAVSLHALGGSSSALMAYDIPNDATMIWFEDVALTSGRAMPSSGLSVTKKIPAIGIRGYQ